MWNYSLSSIQHWIWIKTGGMACPLTCSFHLTSPYTTFMQEIEAFIAVQQISAQNHYKGLLSQQVSIINSVTHRVSFAKRDI